MRSFIPLLSSGSKMNEGKTTTLNCSVLCLQVILETATTLYLESEARNHPKTNGSLPFELRLSINVAHYNFTYLKLFKLLCIFTTNTMPASYDFMDSTKLSCYYSS
jgi:hypothetical protein